MLRTEQKAPRVSSSTGHPQGPAGIQRIFYRLPDVLVGVIGHSAAIILRSPRLRSIRRVELTVADAGLQGQDDSSQLERAAANGRAIYTKKGSCELCV